MRWADAEEIFVPKIGLADGLIHTLYEEVKLKEIERLNNGILGKGQLGNWEIEYIIRYTRNAKIEGSSAFKRSMRINRYFYSS